MGSLLDIPLHGNQRPFDVTLRLELPQENEARVLNGEIIMSNRGAAETGLLWGTTDEDGAETSLNFHTVRGHTIIADLTNEGLGYEATVMYTIERGWHIPVDDECYTSIHIPFDRPSAQWP